MTGSSFESPALMCGGLPHTAETVLSSHPLAHKSIERIKLTCGCNIEVCCFYSVCMCVFCDLLNVLHTQPPIKYILAEIHESDKKLLPLQYIFCWMLMPDDDDAILIVCTCSLCWSSEESHALHVF